ncbi:MAG: SpoIID/LytB domain-containing protein [Knoellia sp.]
MNRLTSVATAAILLAAPMTAVASASSAAPAAPRGTTAPTAKSAESTPAADSLATDRVREEARPAAASGAAAATGPVIALNGRGFGHGRGMSQWGARGAANQGKTVAEILDFYYPGTTAASIGNPEVRVNITAMNQRPTVVVAESGLTLTDGTCTDPLTRAGATQWRSTPLLGGTWKLEAYVPANSSWFTVTSPCASFASAKHLTFVGDGSIANSVITLVTPSGNRQYRGGLRSTIVNLTSASVSGTVNVLAMDAYLRSVVPAEMPASWSLEAVKAQAVAARSYTAARLGSTKGFDICDTTACQVYPGLTSSNPEHPNSDAAITATSGQVRKYGTAIAQTEFSSTNGGQIVGSNLPYQVSKTDPYDGVYTEAPDTWSYLTMPVSAIESAWSTIGTFRSMKISRTGVGAWFGGRASSIELTGTTGTQSVSAETFRSKLNLRSTWFIPVGSSVGTDFAGNGFSDLIARDAAGTLWNYPGDGRGGWLPRTPIATGWPAAPEVLAPGDFSGDGIPDLMRRTTAGAFTLHLGSGTGTIASTKSLGGGWQAFNAMVAPGDLNGDGAVDLLARDSTGTLWLYPGNGAGAFKARISKGTGWASMQELEAVGDFNGDGGSDLIGKTSSGLLFLFRFSATGTYLGPVEIGHGFQAFSALTGLGDVDGDGPLDLVTRDSAGVLWAYRGTGTGTLLTRVKIGSSWTPLMFGS